MKVFVWDYLTVVSREHLAGGGIVVFAESLERAILVAEQAGATVTVDDIPDAVRDCADGPEFCHVHIDEGCC